MQFPSTVGNQGLMKEKRLPSLFRQGKKPNHFLRDLPPFYCPKSKYKLTDYIGKQKGLF